MHAWPILLIVCCSVEPWPMIYPLGNEAILPSGSQYRLRSLGRDAVLPSPHWPTCTPPHPVHRRSLGVPARPSCRASSFAGAPIVLRYTPLAAAPLQAGLSSQVGSCSQYTLRPTGPDQTPRLPQVGLVRVSGELGLGVSSRRLILEAQEIRYVLRWALGPIGELKSLERANW